MHTADVCIVGSGFAGSLIAWALARRGVRVALVDRQTHPRFAIGESSTPLADFLLREIGRRYDLPEVLPLCTWGSWRKAYPQLRCGKKRGFSYFQHQADEAFSDTDDHERSYMVTATATDEQSDTHWMRADVDAWLFDGARQAGVETFEASTVEGLSQVGDQWRLRLHRLKHDVELECGFLVDSTGSGEMLPHCVSLERVPSMLTNTAAVFGHFRNVASMSSILPTSHKDPFDADDAAQHHLLSDACWCWMLRFSDGTTSVGLTGPAQQFAAIKNHASVESFWREQVQRYPTLLKLLSEAVLVDPQTDFGPSLGWLPNITRLWQEAAGANWAMLPTTAGIVDPMHSTGIAHSLSGVLRLLDILTEQMPQKHSSRSRSLAEYSHSVVDEVRWIDLLVALSHRGMRISMDVFAAASSLYFVAAVHCERSMASPSHSEQSMREGFLMEKSLELRRIASEAFQRLSSMGRSPSQRTQRQFIDWMREQIRPWNDFGLLAPEANNRIWRSSVDK